MDSGNGISDAEMRLITVNGQTIMLEGDFENINITNEFLNEMVMVSNSKIDIDPQCNANINENACINCEKETSEEASKLQISIRGENNEVQMIQIGVEEAKALGLCLHEYKCVETANSINCPEAGLIETTSISEEKMNERSGEETHHQRVKLHSVPLVSVGCPGKEPNTVFYVNDMTKTAENSELNSENYPFDIEPKVDKDEKNFQEDSSDGLPAIGHLEGFQIPTSEDKLLLPATVNAKMVDGSYQTITLVPQVANGAVTYTVHFSNLSSDILDRNIRSSNSIKGVREVGTDLTSVNKEQLQCNEIGSVEHFLGSVQLIKSNPEKKVMNNDVKSDGISFKASKTNFPSSFSENGVIKANNLNCEGAKSSEVSIKYTHQNQLPIDAKIDNLISENENVISSCKKVKYGKKVKSSEVDSKVNSMLKISKNNISKAKKVKFKGKALKFFNELDKKKQKLSLLKPSNDHKFEVFSSRSSESEKPFNGTQMPHMNLNGRLEYPNLKAIDETGSSLSYLKVKNSQTTKQPYFNVLPYPKSKTIPIQKQILPLNCDLQQAKNIISLQKFLESQKLQLKIQPLVSNGNKIINIRPKPTLTDEVKVGVTSTNSHHGNKDFQDKHLISEVSKECKAQESEPANKSYQNHVNIQDIHLKNGKLKNLKLLQPHSPNFSEEDALKQTSSDCTTKLNGIFIKNNPEYFTQKVKDRREDEHPLGSSENPIQLVQTGHTFHSRQPLSEAQLQQIASILQKQKFDSPSIEKNSIFDPKTNTRIVYRVVYPEDVDLKDPDKAPADPVNKKKRRRHKNKLDGGEDEVHKKTSPGRPRRPKKSINSVVEEDFFEEEVEDSLPKKKIPRTRSGRLSRPPRYMVKDYRRLHNSEVSDKTGYGDFESDEIYLPYQNGEKVQLDGRADNFSNLEIDSHLLPGLLPQPRNKRNFKPEYRCPTCQKIYLGHTRMMWHLNKFPDHCNVEKYKENYYRKRTETKVRRAARRLNVCDVRSKVKQALNTMAKDELISFCGPLLADALTTWDFLLLRLNLLKNNKKDEVDALIHELILLLEKLTKVAEDIFLPVFTKESEKDEDCVEIDRMEVAIALGLPVGFYKVNNDNLSLLRYPLTKPHQDSPEKGKNENGSEGTKARPEEIFPKEEKERQLIEEKTRTWKKSVDEMGSKQHNGGSSGGSGGDSGADDSFWLEGKTEEAWHDPEEPVKTLSTKFEPNLSTKLLESSNDSIDDSKYEEAVPLINLDANSKDVEQSNSSETLIEAPDMILNKRSEDIPSCQVRNEDKPSLWTETSRDKAPGDLWTEGGVETKSSSELWPNENSNMAATGDKPDDSHLWNENSNLTVGEKVDETNSEFLESLLSVPNSNEFLDGNSTRNFLADNISFDEKPNDSIKSNDSVEEKTKRKWTADVGGGDDNTYMRVWNSKSSSWQKEESILSATIQPGVRTTTRLTSTPESNGNVPFTISNRRNSISDFSNINLVSNNLDVVLPSAKTLMKDCLKPEDLKEEPFLEGADNYKVKNWENESEKATFNSTNVNSEDLMKMALESLTSQHDVINVPPSGFDSAMGILNQNQETGNLNLFAAGEPDADALDFNLPLPDHLLRSNFASCEQGEGNAFQNGGSSSAFLSTTNNIFASTCALPNSIKFDEQFETNFASGKKAKSLDDVMEFFGGKASFNGFETGSGGSGMNHFSFSSEPSEGNGGEGGGSGRDRYQVQVSSPSPMKKKKARGKKEGEGEKRVRKTVKNKTKTKKAVDYPKGNSIESIINEALFESCSSASKASSLQMNHSSPNRNSTMTSSTENYSLPIISGTLDEVENLDFLGQD